jgi:transcriptional regulator with XRE-family HTH domain
MVVRLDQLVQPSPSSYYWWHAYGPFDPGEDGFPHVGQVIRHYRVMLSMEIEELAQRLNISVRRAYELEETVAMPKSISRRQAVANILGIPFALLNLPRQTVVQPAALQTDMQSTVHAGSNTVIHPDTIQAYEDVLDLAWETYYTSNAQRSARTLNYWQQHLLNVIHVTSGISQDQLIALYCRFLQLGSVIARDRLDTDRAITDANKAVELAFQLKNAELIAASLYRRAKIYVEKQEYDLASKDVEGALPYAGRSRDPLRCYVSVFLAEVYSLVAPAGKQLQRKSLALLDDVGRTVRAKGVLEGDGSYAKVDLPGLYMIRGDVLRRHGNIQEAQDALIIVSDSLPPEFTRWRGNLRISEAQLAYAEKDIDGSCHLAIDALSIVEATRSRSNRTKIEHLYTNLSDVDAQHPLVKDLGMRLGLR